MTEVTLGYRVPDSQRLRYTITPLNGQLMNAEAVGGQIDAIAKLLRECAKETDDGLTWLVAILNIETTESGEIVIDLILAPKIPGEGNGVKRPTPDTPEQRMRGVQ